MRRSTSARHFHLPEFVASIDDTLAAAHAAAWLKAQQALFGSEMTLSIGGSRESEAPSIYAPAKKLIIDILSHAA